MDLEFWHPERHSKRMVFLPTPEQIVEGHPKPTPEQLAPLRDPRPFPVCAEDWQIELCHACGWKVDHECASYESRVKVVSARDNIGWWALDSQLILVDRINNPETLGNDLMTQNFLRSQPDCKIPLLKEMKCISQPTDNIHFTLMSRAEGVTLQSIWYTLSDEEQLSYSHQVGDIIKELRKFTSPVPMKVDGTPLDDIVVGHCALRVGRAPFCKKIGSTGHIWFDNLAEEIRDGLAKVNHTNDPEVIEAKFQELRSRFPDDQGPYVLTHTDLSPTNIFVKDGKIEAIIDWEWAGFYPWWVERFRSPGFNPPQPLLFEPLYPYHFEGEMSQKEFSQWLEPIREVQMLFNRCYIEHPGMEGYWQRPTFCECQKYGGILRSHAFGLPTGHRLVYKGYQTEKEMQANVNANWEKSHPEEKTLNWLWSLWKS